METGSSLSEWFYLFLNQKEQMGQFVLLDQSYGWVTTLSGISFLLVFQMENQHIKIYQQGDQVICCMDDQQKRMEGTGNTVPEALAELSAILEASLHSTSYRSEFLLEQLLALNAIRAEYNLPTLEKL